MNPRGRNSRSVPFPFASFLIIRQRVLVSGHPSRYLAVMVIGVTGQIGSGKSTAASILAECGAVVIDADRIGHEVTADTPALRVKLAHEFGEDIFDSRGRLLRKKLAHRAFATKRGRHTLNRLVHPYLVKRLRKRVRDASRHGHVVIDAALLLDWGMDRELDFILVIHSGLETRLKRLAQRGITRADALARQRAQRPIKDYRKRADRVMMNSESKASLKRKLLKLWNKLAS